MKVPIISVIIPTKNRGLELKRAVQSVLNQTFQNFEILVIDDHSDEAIKDVVESFQEDRVIYYKSDKIPSNANVCRNIGFNNAKGEYIAMLDSDDEWQVSHLESRLDFLTKNGCDGVFGSYTIFDGEKYREIISRSFQPKESMADYILTSGRAATPTHFYKAACAKSIMWNEHLLRHQDYDFSIRFAEKYKFLPNSDVSVIVHWIKGETRTVDYTSQMRFIELHKSRISRKVYCSYHQDQWFNLKGVEVSNSIRKHYNKERFRYIHSLSFVDFMSSQESDLKIVKKVLLRFSYALKVILNNEK
jgi:glycosyltransferase involved in cell wall biosynthesis